MGANQKRREKGREYEKLAERYLVGQDYEILERNWMTGHKEIDLIARKDNTVVFVEVKSSGSLKFGHPSERVDDKKQHNLIIAAEQYIISKDLHDCDFRFDLITFLEGKIEHYPNAFQVE